MRRILLPTVAAAALLTGLSGTAATAQSAQNPGTTTTYSPAPTTIVQPLDCHGTTGDRGCGPGWIWNGDRCVPCGS